MKHKKNLCAALFSVFLAATLVYLGINSFVRAKVPAEAGSTVNEGDVLPYPDWGAEGSGLSILYFDENQSLCGSDFSPETKNYTVPSYKDILKCTDLPEIKAGFHFDGWKIVQIPEQDKNSLSYFLERRVKRNQSAREGGEPAETPSSEPAQAGPAQTAAADGTAEADGPDETGRLPETDKPAQTASSTQNAPTDYPARTEKPDETGKPPETDKPAQTASSTQIAPTDYPARTEKPDETGKPPETDKPAQTASSTQNAPTENPAKTDEPAPTPTQVSAPTYVPDSVYISKPDVYRLNKDTIYILSSSLFNVNGDNTVYMANTKVRVSENGSYIFH